MLIKMVEIKTYIMEKMGKYSFSIYRVGLKKNFSRIKAKHHVICTSFAVYKILNKHKSSDTLKIIVNQINVLIFLCLKLGD